MNLKFGDLTRRASNKLYQWGFNLAIFTKIAKLKTSPKFSIIPYSAYHLLFYYLLLYKKTDLLHMQPHVKISN